MIPLGSSQIKAILFDLDGTLIDAYQAIIQSFNHTMRRLHYPVKPDTVIRRAVGWGDENLLKPFVRREDLARALRIYRHHHKGALLKGSRLLPGVKRTLKYLKAKGYILAVASNRPTRFSRILVVGLKLAPFFSYMLCADKLKHGKPHPEILKKIMKRLSVEPHEALYVGDMRIDAQAGRRARVKTIVVTTGSSSLREIKKENPFCIIKKISHLKEIV